MKNSHARYGLDESQAFLLIPFFFFSNFNLEKMFFVVKTVHNMVCLLKTSVFSGRWVVN